MVRRYEYDGYVEENKARYLRACLGHLSERGRRPVRSRPRDPVESALLDRLALDAWHRAITTGELEILGPRRYRLRGGC